MTENDISISYNYGSDGADLQLRHHVTQDGARTVKFEGVRLASVTSESNNRPRWTVIDLYRTRGDMFIIHRVGVSSVIHYVDCLSISGKRLPGPEGIKPDETPLEGRTPCMFCSPNVDEAMAEDPLSLRIEVDRHYTAVCPNAPQVVEKLMTNRTGVRSLSFLALNLLKDAAEHDPRIAALPELNTPKQPIIIV